ncbi:MAG: hypothetical protein E7027_04440 [Elusimicrobium sp.]|uniref:Uncharacterized protein n=1 Tax=Candidatus Avelusimicrobium gallicola TaxID=2562704 RepID=A0A928HF37_9BACT|nr:hypothetical protein [Elusimicrobium sp.]
MLTEVEIANKALGKLGIRPISSLDDQEESARVAKAMFGTVRDYELSIYRWLFALKRTLLAKDAQAPAFGYENQYSLPPDFLRLEMVEGKPANLKDSYLIEGNKILTDLPAPLKIIYISREVEMVKWPPFFVEAFACKLAYEMCERLKQDPSRKNTLLTEYQLIIRDAKRANAIQLPAQALPATELEIAQYGF